MRIPEAEQRADTAVPIAHRGTTQSGVRAYNERLVLSMIRENGALPKAEIARRTGLSAQTVSVIVRQLESDDLLIRRDVIKGKVGQPLQPYSLNPEGAYSIGLKVGRRSGDLVLLGLDGGVRNAIRHPYHFPSPQEFLRFARSSIEDLVVGLGPLLRKRISGIGIAMPFDIWKWEEETGASSDVAKAWADFDLARAIEESCEWPIIKCNDATAACAAELLFGKGATYRDFAYIYIGYFVGGGLVIDGRLQQGPSGNAGAVGSMPVPKAGGGHSQLIHTASTYLLEQSIRNQNGDPSILWYDGRSWGGAGKALDHWIETAAEGLAFASASLASTLECQAVIIDGAIPVDVRARLVSETRKRMASINLNGISPFAVEEGTIGFDARAMGAASLPLFANFMIDRDVLFKSTA